MAGKAKKSGGKGKAKKAAKKSGKGGRRRKAKQTWSTYIIRVLKQVHSSQGASRKAVAILNSFVNDIFERVATEASRLTRINKTKTLTSREIQTAVRLVLPGELSKHAMSEGTKAIAKFTASQSGKKKGGKA